jgi:hypothetical protein
MRCRADLETKCKGPEEDGNKLAGGQNRWTCGGAGAE